MIHSLISFPIFKFKAKPSNGPIWFKDPLIYLQKMESPRLWYCLNPTCVRPGVRVFQKKDSSLHSRCDNWIISQAQIAGFSHVDFPFSMTTPLLFKQKPIETQAYLHFNKKQLVDSLAQFVINMKKEVDNIFEELVNYMRSPGNGLFSFSKYEQINCLARQAGLDSDLKSKRLAQLLNKPLPLFENVKLPSPQTFALMISNIRKDLEKIFDVQALKPGETCRQVKQQASCDLTKLEFLDVEKELTSSKLQQHIKTEVKEQDELQELWDYIVKNCNLNTATRLMGEPLQRFYQHDGEGKQSVVKCCYCPFTVKIKTRSKPQTNSACSYAILEHLHKEHPSATLYQFSLLKGTFSSYTFPLLLQKIASIEMQSVSIIDSSAMSDVKQIYLEEHTFAFQIIFGRNKPLFRSQFLRGTNPKEIMVLIGLIIAYGAIACKKKVLVYSSAARCEVINHACKQHGIEGVISLIGNMPMGRSVSVLKKSKQSLIKSGKNDLE